MDQEIILESESLSKNFGSIRAVQQVSFGVRKQEIFGFIGPNGAGKSTLIKMLTTLLDPSEGTALIDGIDLIKKPARIRRLIGYVPQLISTDGSLTGYENLLVFSKLYDIPKKERKARVEEALQIMGLSKVAHRYVREYSGGMIRRLEIIQATLNYPKIIFLDEPTSGLDPTARHALWEYLIKIHNQYSMTIILTTHDMQEAEFLCERIAIMLRGKIVNIGTIQELKASVGPKATLNDVFLQYTGGSLESENAYYDTLAQRNTDHRRG